MRLKIFIILIFSFLTREATSQINIMGKPGYINTPSAQWEAERPIHFSMAHLPGAYSVFRNELTSVNFYNTGVSITSFFQVNISIAHRPAKAEIDRLGIGDRQLDFRFRLLKEKKYWPALVLGWTPPGSSAPFLAHDYIVATKNFILQKSEVEISVGYSSPYVFWDNEFGNDNPLAITKKSESRLNTYYLRGFFAGLSYRPVQYLGIMAEYDSNTINAGAFIQPWEWLILQGTTYEGKEFAFSAALNFSLSFLPHSLRKHEKVQD